jgi:hypothetical protein
MLTPNAALCFFPCTTWSNGVYPEEWFRTFYDHCEFRVQNHCYYYGLSSWQFYSCFLTDSLAVVSPSPPPYLTSVQKLGCSFSSINSNKLWHGGTSLILSKLKPWAERQNSIVNVSGNSKLEDVLCPAARLGTGTNRWRGKSVFAYNASTPWL